MRLHQRSTASHRLHAIAETMAQFQRLERAFDAIGWDFYPLHGKSCLAVHRAWGVSAVCHSLGEAFSLLRRVRGAPA
jgi:hypothetical protein